MAKYTLKRYISRYVRLRLRAARVNFVIYGLRLCLYVVRLLLRVRDFAERLNLFDE